MNRGKNNGRKWATSWRNSVNTPKISNLKMVRTGTDVSKMTVMETHGTASEPKSKGFLKEFLRLVQVPPLSKRSKS